MDLFEKALEETIRREAPLADRMRPRTLEEFVGQEHILAPGRLLRRAIQADQLSSLIFYGPPGTGKTALARIIANTTRSEFLSINAVLAGIPAIRECIETARKLRLEQGRRTLLFIDEVHRFNKAQQDALLPHVENGMVVLIGATTENPYFEVIKALVSRSRIFQLKALERSHLEKIINASLVDSERGYGKRKVVLDDEARLHLAQVASGDARAALNALELAVLTSEPDPDGNLSITLEIAEESIQQRAVLYDKDGDAHFDTISAFIKSLRGSDPDAALYWMAKMVEAGEDPRFLFRRMLIFAGEDVGMADPYALGVVSAAAQAFDYVGMPEGRFHLAQACLYLSTAKKSNSAFAFFDALKTVRKESSDEAPDHLKDANRDSVDFGHGEGYLYPHAFREHWVAQRYLPETLQGRVFYQPGKLGYEKTISDEVAKRREAQLAAFLSGSGIEEEGVNYWESRTLGGSGEYYAEVRDILIKTAAVSRGLLCLVLNAGDGLVLGELRRLIRNEPVYTLVNSASEERMLRSTQASIEENPEPLIAVDESGVGPEVFGVSGLRFQRVLGRNWLQGKEDPVGSLKLMRFWLAKEGTISLAETNPSLGQRLSGLIPTDAASEKLMREWREAESALYEDRDNPQLAWTPESLKKQIEEEGWHIKAWRLSRFITRTHISVRQLEAWFGQNGVGNRSYGQRLAADLGKEKVAEIHQLFHRHIAGKPHDWQSACLFLSVGNTKVV